MGTIDTIIEIEMQIEQLRLELSGALLTIKQRLAAMAEIAHLRKAMDEIALNAN
jgi:hypothetical protein